MATRAANWELGGTAGGRGEGRAKARRLAALRQRRMRLLVLLLAILLPTVAAHGRFGGPVGSVARALGLVEDPAQLVPEPFETPGESFPGSAFYWLEDPPPVADDLVALSGSDRAAARATGGQAVGFADSAPGIGSAAEAFRTAGSGLDKARALQCLSMAVYYEAASESIAGQEAVAQVVLNRVAHPAYPNSVCGVVLQGAQRKTGCQFTFTCDGSLSRHPNRLGWARAQGVALAALSGFVYAPVGLATHYHANYVNPYWAPSLDYVATVGAHRFYRWKGKAGQAGAFTNAYTGFEGVSVPAPGSAASVPRAVPAVPPPNSALGLPGTANPPVAGASSPKAAPLPARTDTLPGAGGVKAEYRNSGRWIAEPGKPRSD